MFDVEAIAKKLNETDVAELESCRRCRRGYVLPRFNRQSGKMLSEQWRSWQKLQRYALGHIEGAGEAESFAINSLGRAVLAKRKA